MMKGIIGKSVVDEAIESLSETIEIDEYAKSFFGLGREACFPRTCKECGICSTSTTADVMEALRERGLYLVWNVEPMLHT